MHTPLSCKILFNHDCKMQKFCLLCMKKGIKSRMKAFQINLQEAVWSCEKIDCIWPLGYQDTIIFPRSAMTCNWNDSYFNEESTATLSELSLYTPPMTPRGEVSECSTNSIVEDKFNESISSRRESTDCNKLPLELANRFTKGKDISRNTNKQMPEIVNIEKVNIDITRFFQHKYLDNERTQKHLCATSLVDTAVDSNTLFASTNEFSSHTWDKTGNEQSKNDNVQVSEAVACLDANTDINIQPMSTDSKVNVNILDNSNVNDYFTLDTTGATESNLDTMLDSILNDVKDITREMEDNDWLDLIQL